MAGLLFIIAIIYILYQVLKEKKVDSEVKNAARKNGQDWYASSTGIRDIKTNKKVWLDGKGNKEFLE